MIEDYIRDLGSSRVAKGEPFLSSPLFISEEVYIHSRTVYIPRYPTLNELAASLKRTGVAENLLPQCSDTRDVFDRICHCVGVPQCVL